jgi:DNA-binding PadR family transcriptional regulator
MRLQLLKLLILLLIHHSRGLHGYELMKKIENLTRGLWRPGPGTIYPVLFILKSEKLVRDEKSDRRKKYVLTEKGVEYLRENLPKLYDMIRELEEIIREVIEDIAPTQS